MVLIRRAIFIGDLTEFSDPLYWPRVGDILRRLDIAILPTHIHTYNYIYNAIREARRDGEGKGEDKELTRARTMCA